MRKFSAISYQLSQTNTSAKNFSVDVELAHVRSAASNYLCIYSNPFTCDARRASKLSAYG
ncbi:hypothetical protein PAGA_a0715 [Pseudoalteromonas agarivorans DSM 14585]|uniref:Uncharacterized protein n=1 Tax=Pseudoalteromonas agarivorans DSM 14585 TaxID=1312369 RepID=A0ACA8DTW4_9GAMM|nr:hypothetical protein PAGA_a0715 [Pseudoalteromonas agarivorans DSM 14585]